VHDEAGYFRSITTTLDVAADVLIGTLDRKSVSAKHCIFDLKYHHMQSVIEILDRQEMLETPARIEPILFEDGVPVELADLAVELRRPVLDAEHEVDLIRPPLRA
jgi:hypothetical protein